MALSAGAGSIASDRERGMLPYLLAQPITRLELLLGKFVGLAMTLTASICLGFGAVAAALAWSGSATRPASLIELAALSIALALAMLSVGLLISTLAHRTGVSTGTAVFVWLGLVFVSDLGLMASSLTFKLPIEKLFALALLNPMQVFKMWSLQSVDASLDVLGPAGLYAQETYGSLLNLIFSACLALWTFVPLAIASVIFSRRSSP
jgi:Cu-processing system permease protein